LLIHAARFAHRSKQPRIYAVAHLEASYGTVTRSGRLVIQAASLAISKDVLL
jgi:hypothetical protein